MSGKLKIRQIENDSIDFTTNIDVLSFDRKSDKIENDNFDFTKKRCFAIWQKISNKSEKSLNWKWRFWFHKKPRCFAIWQKILKTCQICETENAKITILISRKNWQKIVKLKMTTLFYEKNVFLSFDRKAGKTHIKLDEKIIQKSPIFFRFKGFCITWIPSLILVTLIVILLSLSSTL